MEKVIEKRTYSTFKWMEFLMEQRLIVITIVLAVLMTILSNGTFLQPGNLANLLSQSAIVGIITIAQCLVILMAGIDLSVGAILAASSLAYVFYQGMGVFPSIILALAVGVFFGFLNGFFITKFKLTPFIVTLAVMEISRGVSLTAVNGEPITQIDSAFLVLGSLRPFGISLQVYIWLILAVVAYIFLTHTHWGKAIYATGGNEKAARLSGINTGRIKIMVYTISGFLCAIAGILFTSRLAVGEPTAGGIYNLDSIAAVVIGGVALSGGEGKLTNAMLGVVIFAMLSNFMNLAGVSPFYQQGLKGIIVILAIMINIKQQAKAAKKTI
jgi:ribose/xylose/arabinose/galactoside ABC-type transport system permease subunit